MKTLTICFAILSVLLTLGAFVPAAQAAPCPNGPEYHYISHSPAKCATIRFFCEEGQEPFFNECGCGCKDITALAAATPMTLVPTLPAQSLDADTLPLFTAPVNQEACELPQVTAG